MSNLENGTPEKIIESINSGKNQAEKIQKASKALENMDQKTKKEFDNYLKEKNPELQNIINEARKNVAPQILMEAISLTNEAAKKGLSVNMAMESQIVRDRTLQLNQWLNNNPDLVGQFEKDLANDIVAKSISFDKVSRVLNNLDMYKGKNITQDILFQKHVDGMKGMSFYKELQSNKSYKKMLKDIESDSLMDQFNILNTLKSNQVEIKKIEEQVKEIAKNINKNSKIRYDENTNQMIFTVKDKETLRINVLQAGGALFANTGKVLWAPVRAIGVALTNGCKEGSCNLEKAWPDGKRYWTDWGIDTDVIPGKEIKISPKMKAQTEYTSELPTRTHKVEGTVETITHSGEEKYKDKPPVESLTLFATSESKVVPSERTKLDSKLKSVGIESGKGGNHEYVYEASVDIRRESESLQKGRFQEWVNTPEFKWLLSNGKILVDDKPIKDVKIFDSLVKEISEDRKAGDENGIFDKGNAWLVINRFLGTAVECKKNNYQNLKFIIDADHLKIGTSGRKPDDTAKGNQDVSEYLQVDRRTAGKIKFRPESMPSDEVKEPEYLKFSDQLKEISGYQAQVVLEIPESLPEHKYDFSPEQIQDMYKKTQSVKFEKGKSPFELVNNKPRVRLGAEKEIWVLHNLIKDMKELPQLKGGIDMVFKPTKENKVVMNVIEKELPEIYAQRKSNNDVITNHTATGE